MRVRFSGEEGQEKRVARGSERLRERGVYPVLELYFKADGQNFFRIQATDGDFPFLFDSRLFDIVDGSLPACWQSFISGGSISIRPPAWNEAGFWEALLDGDEEAWRCFEKYRSSILAEGA